MTTETDCPSHIEARERLQLALGDHFQYPNYYDLTSLPKATIGDLRTLLATPTQGRDRYAAEEEICRIVRSVYDAGAKGAERGATFVKAECDLLALHGIDGLNSDADVQEGVGREEIARAVRDAIDGLPGTAGVFKPKLFDAEIAAIVDAVSSLLPAPKPPAFPPMGSVSGSCLPIDGHNGAPKPGGLGPQLRDYEDTPSPFKVLAAHYNHQQPAPGAPEGWQKLSPDEQFALATRIAANVGYELKPEPPLPALTSSSAKPVGEPLFKLPTDGPEYDALVSLSGTNIDLELKNEALAQSNQRLSRLLTEILTVSGAQPGLSCDDCFRVLIWIEDKIKDNHHLLFPTEGEAGPSQTSSAKPGGEDNGDYSLEDRLTFAARVADVSKDVAALLDEAAQTNRRLREVLYVIAPHHQGGHSETGKMIAAALGCDFPLDMDRLKAKALADGLDPDVLWPWLAKTNAIRVAALKDNGHG